MLFIETVLKISFILTAAVAIPMNDLIQESVESEESAESLESLESLWSPESPESIVSLLPVEPLDPVNVHDDLMNKDFIAIDLCRVGCPRILDPICAIDASNSTTFKYFHNKCLMEYDSCRREKAWKPTHMLSCLADVEPTIHDDCLRPCPFIYDPVCASNGEYVEIFGNQCIFGMENCLASGKWHEVRGEVCGL